MSSSFGLSGASKLKLMGKKTAKAIPAGATITLIVQNSDNTLSIGLALRDDSNGSALSRIAALLQT